MSKLDSIKEKIFIPKKETNESYNSWLSSANEDLRKELESLDNKQVNASFKEDLRFDYRYISGEVGLGNSKLNIYTVERIFRAIKIFAKQKGWKVAMFGASNLERFELVKSAINHLNTDGIETRMFENPNMMLSELSYTIKNRGYDFGIYINSNNVRTSIRVLGENGRLLKESELEDLNAILETLELDFNLEENKVNKIKIVSDEYRISYENKILSNIEWVKRGKISKENAILINVSSSLMYNYLEPIVKEHENVHIHLSQKGNRADDYNVSSPSSYREAYFVANKKKVNTIINIDGSGSRVSVAVKHNKTWEFITSDKLFALLLNKMREEERLVKGDKILSTIYSSPLIFDLIKKIGAEPIVHEEGFTSKHSAGVLASGDIYYQYSFMADVIAPDAVIPTAILFSYFVEKQTKVDLIVELEKLSNKTYYERIITRKKDYNEFKEDLKHIETEKYIGDLKVKSVKLMDKDDKRILIKINTTDGYVMLRYSLVSNLLTMVFHISNYEEGKAFYSRRQATKGMSSVLNQDYKKVENAISKKSMINTGLLFLLTIGILSFTFFYILDWNSISEAFSSIAAKADTPYPYLLIGSAVLSLFGQSFFLWIIMKMIIEKNIKYRHLLIGTMLSQFIGAIGVSFVMGPAFFLYYMRKQKYHAPDIMAALALQQIVLPLLMAVLNIYFLSVGNAYLLGMTPFYMPEIGIDSTIVTSFSWVGWAWVSFNTFFYIVLAYSQRVHNFILFWVEKGLFIVKYEGRIKSIKEELDFNAKKMRNSMKFVTTSPKKVSIIALPAVSLTIFNQFQASFALNIVAENPLNNYWQTMTLGTIMGNASIFVPIPGKSGLTEWFGKSVYATVIANNPTNFGIDHLQWGTDVFNTAVEGMAEQVAFLDRFSYYIKLGATGSFFTGWMVKQTFFR